MDLTVLRWKIVPANGRKDLGPEDEALQSPQKATLDGITADVERGRIHELTSSMRNKLPTTLESSFRPDDSYNTLRRPDSPERKTTARRPGTASAHKAVQSRLLNTTASMSTKQAHGRAQRAHILQQEQAKRRFSTY